LLNGIFGYWKMDEANGTRFDSTQTGFNLLDTNNNVLSATGKIRAGALFNHNYLVLTETKANLLAGTTNYWKLDEESGTRFDSTQTGNNLLDTNSNVLSVTGKINRGAQFDHSYLLMTDTQANLLAGATSYWKLNEGSGTRFNSVTSVNLLDTMNNVISGVGVINIGAVFNHTSLQT
jgi:hypothetical protein